MKSPTTTSLITTRWEAPGTSLTTTRWEAPGTKIDQHIILFQIIKTILHLIQLQHQASKRMSGRPILPPQPHQYPEINLSHAISDQNTAAMKKETDLQDGKDLQTLFLCKYYGLVKKKKNLLVLIYDHAWIVD